MGLVQVNSATVTSNTADVLIDGINTDDVYMLVASGITHTVDTAYLRYTVTKDVSGTTTKQTTSNYDFASKVLRSHTTFQNYGQQNRAEMYFQGSQPVGNATGEDANCILYLYNFNNSSEFSYVTVQDISFESSHTSIAGNVGGFVYTVQEAHNGIAIGGDATQISGGTFTLYRCI